MPGPKAKQGGPWPILAAVTLLALLVGAMGGYLTQRYRSAASRPSPALVEAARTERVQQHAALPDGARIAMLGDSITGAGQWSELLGEIIANRGISGDRSTQVLDRVATVPASAHTIFLQVGVNDIAAQLPVAEVAANTQRITEALRPRRVVVQSVLFTTNSALNGPIAELNARNRAYCAGGACEYLELNDLFSRGDRLRDDMTVDGIHLRGRAYLLWAERIRASGFADPPGKR